jgi:hypothetical protein
VIDLPTTDVPPTISTVSDGGSFSPSYSVPVGEPVVGATDGASVSGASASVAADSVSSSAVVGAVVGDSVPSSAVVGAVVGESVPSSTAPDSVSGAVVGDSVPSSAVRAAAPFAFIMVGPAVIVGKLDAVGEKVGDGVSVGNLIVMGGERGLGGGMQHRVSIVWVELSMWQLLIFGTYLAWKLCGRIKVRREFGRKFRRKLEKTSKKKKVS